MDYSIAELAKGVMVVCHLDLPAILQHRVKKPSVSIANGVATNFNAKPKCHYGLTRMDEDVILVDKDCLQLKEGRSTTYM